MNRKRTEHLAKRRPIPRNRTKRVHAKIKRRGGSYGQPPAKNAMDWFNAGIDVAKGKLNEHKPSRAERLFTLVPSSLLPREARQAQAGIKLRGDAVKFGNTALNTVSFHGNRVLKQQNSQNGTKFSKQQNSNGNNTNPFGSFSQHNNQSLNQSKLNNNSAALTPNVTSPLSQDVRPFRGAVNPQNQSQSQPNPLLASNSQQSTNGQQSDNQNSVIQMLLGTLQSPEIRQQLIELFDKLIELNKSSESSESKQAIINNLIDIVVMVTGHNPSDTINIGNYTYKLQRQPQTQ